MDIDTFTTALLNGIFSFFIYRKEGLEQRQEEFNEYLHQLIHKLEPDDEESKREGIVLDKEAVVEKEAEVQAILDQLELDSNLLDNLENEVASEVKQKLLELGLPTEGCQTSVMIWSCITYDNDTRLSLQVSR